MTTGNEHHLPYWQLKPELTYSLTGTGWHAIWNPDTKFWELFDYMDRRGSDLLFREVQRKAAELIAVEERRYWVAPVFLDDGFKKGALTRKCDDMGREWCIASGHFHWNATAGAWFLGGTPHRVIDRRCHERVPHARHRWDLPAEALVDEDGAEKVVQIVVRTTCEGVRGQQFCGNRYHHGEHVWGVGIKIPCPGSPERATGTITNRMTPEQIACELIRVLGRERFTQLQDELLLEKYGHRHLADTEETILAASGRPGQS